MNYSDVQELKHGIYRIHWKEGGSSLAAVGSDVAGNRWLAATNWVSGSTTSTTRWEEVDYITQIHIASEQPVLEPDEEPEAFDWSQSEFWEDPIYAPNQALIDLMQKAERWKTKDINKIDGPW